MSTVRNVIVNGKQTELGAAIRERLADIINVQSRLILTKGGHVQYFNGKRFISIEIEGHVEEITSGDGFALARTSNKRLYMIVLCFTEIRVQALTGGVGKIYACGKQMYFETASGKILGTRLLDLSHFLDDLNEAERHTETYMQFVDEDNQVQLPSGQLLYMSLSVETAGAIVKDKKARTHLWTWGNNDRCQCGKSDVNQVVCTKPYNVSLNYVDLPTPVQVACLRYLTVILTYSKEIFVLGNIGRNTGRVGFVHKINIDDNNIKSIISSGMYTLMIVRKSFGAFICSCNPKDKKASWQGLLKDPIRILGDCSVVDACVSETLVLAKTQINALNLRRGEILDVFLDTNIICVSEQSSRRGKKRACLVTEDISVKKIKINK